MGELQYCSGGTWIDAGDRAEKIIATAERFINNHPNKIALLNGFATVVDKLNAGQQVNAGTDWDDKIRYKPIAKQDNSEKCIDKEICTTLAGTGINDDSI